MRTCVSNAGKPHTLWSTGKRKRERFWGLGLQDIWKVFRKEVALELRVKLQAEQKANAPNQTIDSLVKSGFCLQTLKEEVPYSTFSQFSVTEILLHSHQIIALFSPFITEQPSSPSSGSFWLGLEIHRLWHALRFPLSLWLYCLWSKSLSLLQALLFANFLLIFTK